MERRTMPVSAATRSSSSRNVQGKWGSACAVCSSAKAKCIRTDPSTGCDRCKRLSKECTDQVHLPRKKRTAKLNRTSQLEERLNGLVDLLRATGDLPVENNRSRQTSSHFAEAEGENTPSQNASPDDSPIPDHDDTVYVPSTWNAVCPPQCVCGGAHGDVRLPRIPDETLLAIYQTQLMPVFPFVVISPRTKVDRLKAERPFLFAAIRMAATITDIRSRRGQMYRLVRLVVEEIAISSVRSVDIVQAILVMLAWFHHHCMMHAQLNTLLHLAQAQLADMGLNQEPVVQERTNLMVLAPGKPLPRSNNEKRAVLGVWYFSSCLSTTLLRVAPPRFTQYLKTCSKDLEDSPEYDSDVLLLHMVKIQRTTEQIHNWKSRDEDEDDIPGLPGAPVGAYQGAFEAEIQRQRESLPPNLGNNRLLRLYFASATLRLYQPPPIEAAVLKNLAESLTVSRLGTPSTIDILYRAKSALETYFDCLFSLSPDVFSLMPVYVSAAALWSVTMLARWAKVMGPGNSRASTAPPDILTPQKVIWDPSALKPIPTAIFGRVSAPAPSLEDGRKDSGREAPDAIRQEPTSRECPSSRLARIPPTITDPSQIKAADMHDMTDPDVARVVVTLKTQLHLQPDLNLDVIGILATLAQQFEEAHKNLQKTKHDGSWQSDFWYLGAKKLLIARARLEKWAEIVAGGGVSAEPEKTATANEGHEQADQSVIEMAQTLPSTQSRPQPEAQENSLPPVQQCAPDPIRHWDDLDAFQREIEAAGVDALPADSVYEPDMYGSVWNDNLFDPLDPSLWLNYDYDWDAVVQGPMQDTQPGF